MTCSIFVLHDIVDRLEEPVEIERERVMPKAGQREGEGRKVTIPRVRSGY